MVGCSVFFGVVFLFYACCLVFSASSCAYFAVASSLLTVLVVPNDNAFSPDVLSHSRDVAAAVFPPLCYIPQWFVA